MHIIRSQIVCMKTGPFKPYLHLMQPNKNTGCGAFSAVIKDVFGTSNNSIGLYIEHSPKIKLFQWLTPYMFNTILGTSFKQDFIGKSCHCPQNIIKATNISSNRKATGYNQKPNANNLHHQNGTSTSPSLQQHDHK